MSNYGKVISAGVAGLVALIGTYFFGKTNGKNEGFSEGREVSKAEYAEKLQKLRATLANEVGTCDRDNFLLAAYALGACCLKANNQLSAENIKHLGDLVSGLVPREKLPKNIQKKITEIIDNPPNLPTVWALINENQLNDLKTLRLFDELIIIMTELDELKTQNENDFVSSWNSLAAA